MGVYKKAVITDAGRAMLARSIAGEIVMQFSRAVTSSHIYPSDTDFKGYTSLEGIQQTVIPSNVQVVNDTLISVRNMFGNESISESYLIQNIGLYATDGNEEILFSVSQATAPDEMPAYNGVAPSSFIYTIQATVSQASSLSLTINPAGTATAQDIQDLDGAKLNKQGDISETVVETLEPIETKFPIPAAGEKVKTFFGKILTFLRSIKPLEADVTYYVATTGNDLTGDGTQSKPFKTIQRAVDSIPKDLGEKDATINIGAGTYPESVLVNGFSNGYLRIVGPSPDTINDVCKVNAFYIRYCTSYVLLNGFTGLSTTDYPFKVWNCQHAFFNCCQVNTASSTIPGIYFGESRGRVSNCKVSNRHSALRVVNSNVYSENWNVGSVGNMYGINCTNGGYISKSSSQPLGTTGNEFTSSGGTIFNENGTQISGIYTAGLSCTWGTINGGYAKHGVPGKEMVTINLEVICNTNLSAGTQYLIAGFPRPLTNIAVSIDIPDTCSLLYLSATDGIIRYLPTINLPTGRIIRFSCTYLTQERR